MFSIHNRQSTRSRKRKSQFRDGERKAVRQAHAAALDYIHTPEITLDDAARDHGVSVSYVRAMVVLISYRDEVLIWSVRFGDVPLLDAAAGVRKRVELMAAMDAANSEDLVHVGRVKGPTKIWDSMVSPAL